MTRVVVLGGGCMGLQVAIQAAKKRSVSSVVLIEKEQAPGLHASGRNSGVLHAGLYYPPHSLKAKLTPRGNRLLRKYCADNGIPVNACGKLVVARDQSLVKQLDLLFERARVNGAPVEMISAKDCRDIEPRALTFERAIWSPSTASADPKLVTRAFEQDARKLGVSMKYGESVTLAKRLSNGWKIQTDKDTFYEADHVVNASGLYGDRIARMFGFSENYRAMPFRGSYLICTPNVQLRTNIYPVPDMTLPFLGVHTTLTVNGSTKIGPTASPIWSREQYQGYVNFSKPLEFFDILSLQANLYLKDSSSGFRNLVHSELGKMLHTRNYLIKQASHLIDGIQPSDFSGYSTPGIRAQLVDTKLHKLEMDFIIEGDHHSTHILNAVSPGWTCCIPLAEMICSRIP